MLQDRRDEGEVVPVFKADDFSPVCLADRGFPELFSLGALPLGDTGIAAACPIFWKESVFIDGEPSATAVSACLLEDVAPQLFSQAPYRVKVIVYDSSFELDAPALEAVSEIIKAQKSSRRAFQKKS